MIMGALIKKKTKKKNLSPKTESNYSDQRQGRSQTFHFFLGGGGSKRADGGLGWLGLKMSFHGEGAQVSCTSEGAQTPSQPPWLRPWLASKNVSD